MEKYSIDKPMAPPWIKYPHFDYRNIVWQWDNKGYYAVNFHIWYQKLSKNNQLNYQEMFPSPKIWVNFFNDDIEEDSFYEELEEHYYKNIFFWRKDGKAKYSIDDFITIDDETNEFMFFWNPENTLESCLSQWTKSDFKDIAHGYNCTEQYMMAQKAIFFQDHENEKRIMETDDPFEMKKLGRKVRNFNSKEWNKVKYSIVLNGNYYKFSQNKEMRDFLIATGDKILVEASPEDKIWGVGLDKSNDDIYNLNKWKGENLLGFALMELRDELKRVYKNYDKLMLL